MGVKDIFDVHGLKTTMMSRAYTELYGPRDGSADYVTKLLSLGAVILGKTRMTAFACSDEPTDQYVDFHCPVNPRGDRYQSPSGSSCGAAASLAGYDWLDISVAGDCTYRKTLILPTELTCSSCRKYQGTSNLQWPLLPSSILQHHFYGENHSEFAVRIQLSVT